MANTPFDDYAGEDFDAYFIVWQDQNAGVPSAATCERIRDRPGGGAEALRMTVLFDANQQLRAYGLDSRHRHYVLSRGGRVQHRSAYGNDRTFRVELDRIFGRP